MEKTQILIETLEKANLVRSKETKLELSKVMQQANHLISRLRKMETTITPVKQTRLDCIIMGGPVDKERVGQTDHTVTQRMGMIEPM